MRWDIEHNPHKYPSNTPGGVQASASQPPDPHWKAFPLLFSRNDVVCLCNHWMVQNIKQHPFLIHAGSVYTICVLFSFHFRSFHTLSHRRTNEPYSQRQEHRVFLFFCTRTTTLYFFMNWLFLVSRLAVARLDWRPFFVNLVNLERYKVNLPSGWRDLQIQPFFFEYISKRVASGSKSYFL